MENVRKDILIRAYIIYAIVLVCGLIIFYRVFSLIFINGNEYRNLVNDNNVRERIVEAPRGNIYSDDKSLLATSLPVFDLYWDSYVVDKDTFNRNVSALANKLSKLFNDKTPREYISYLTTAYNKKTRYLPIQHSDLRNDLKQVSYSDLKLIREFPIFNLGKNRGGLIIEKKDVRKMPYKLLAYRTIGYERIIETKKGIDTTFVGLEGAYSTYLSGVQGKRIEQKMRGGIWVPVSEEDQIEPQNGKDIYTSLNVEFQRVATHSLMKQLDSTKADHGCVILMEVETGYIKAIANLRRRSDGSYGEDMNYAIWESAEPGSTFKLASLLAVLESGSLDTNSIVPTGTFKYGDREMKDSHEEGYGRISLKHAFEVSSNVGISNAVVRAFGIKERTFVDLLRKMGVGNYFNLEIKGEGIPFIKDPKSRSDVKNKNAWSPTTLPWMATGYELQLTPLHILSIYNTVANNGKMMKPQFVIEIRNINEIIKKNEPIVLIEKICSQKTIDKAKACLEGVIKNGTAKKLFNTVYSIAGKTGTAQIAKKGGYGNTPDNQRKIEYKASFVGYFPADNPKYSCIVVVNNPKEKGIYGAEVAAPVFKEIADKVYSIEASIHAENEYSAENKTAPLVKFGRKEDLQIIYKSIKFNTLSTDSYSEWVNSYEAVGNSVRMKSSTPSKTKVPDVRDMGVRDAVFLLESLGLKVVIEGKGTVVSQSLSPNSILKKGLKIKLLLSIPAITEISENQNDTNSTNTTITAKDTTNKSAVIEKSKIEPQKINKKQSDITKNKSDKKEPENNKKATVKSTKKKNKDEKNTTKSKTKDTTKNKTNKNTAN